MSNHLILNVFYVIIKKKDNAGFKTQLPELGSLSIKR